MSNKSNLPFNKNNYKLMIIGVVIIFMGFFIMTLDNEEFLPFFIKENKIWNGMKL